MIPEFAHPLAYLVKRYGIYLVYALLAAGFFLLYKKAGAKTFFLVLAAFVCIVFLLGYWGQKLVIFYPQQEMEATPAKHGVPFSETRMGTADGESLYAWFVPGEKDKPVILFCHGNASTVSDPSYLRFLQLVHDIGLSALIFDYRGFGRSSGSPSEEGTYRDAEAVWEHLRAERDFSARDIVIWGKSLGGGPAAYLATRHPDCRTLVLESTFTSVPEVAQRLIPFLPASRIIHHEYPVARYVRQIGCPVLVMHSPQDETIPYSLGREIYALAPEPKRFLELRGGHVWGLWASRERVVPVLEEFLLSPPQSRAHER
ncbi:MAG: alpha/beta hydrolase [Desulfohalobiaceae bacterium]|nr:alpha/beta hydrolase [Desulfohalobiaceae bacterium]